MENPTLPSNLLFSILSPYESHLRESVWVSFVRDMAEKVEGIFVLTEARVAILYKPKEDSAIRDPLLMM